MECTKIYPNINKGGKGNIQSNDNMVAPAIGIDLGTTYSCVGVYMNGKVEIIPNEAGNKTTPSFVAFTESERLIGETARNQSAMNVENTFYGVKRLIGLSLNDKSVQYDIKHFPYSVVEESEKLKINTTYRGVKKSMFPEEISAMILVKMKQIAETYLGMSITNAVITVPAYFNNSQRQATKDAGTIAGLRVLRIINEPTAAAIAYGIDKRVRDEVNVLIFDLGGGTFDVSILTIEDSIFEVKSTAGNTHLGGEDFDTRLVEHFTEEFHRKYGHDITGDKRSMTRLRKACEKAKRCLSTSSSATIEVPCLFKGIDYDASISRTRFEELNEDLFLATLDSVEQALKDANLEKYDIEDIILIGGSTRIPRIRKLLQDLFPAQLLNKSINPDEAVAYGASIQAAILHGLIPRDLSNILLLDVIPLSLGTGVVGDKICHIIKRNTTIPAKKTATFATSADYQTKILFKVYEGERAKASNNNLLGEFKVDNIPSSLRGIQDISVTYEIDSNGILNVAALLNSTGKVDSITITNKDRFTEDQIKRMVAEAERYKEDDAAFLKRIDSMNKLENYAYEIRTSINDNYYNVTHDARHKILDKCSSTITWLEGNRDSDGECYADLLSQMKKMFSNFI